MVIELSAGCVVNVISDILGAMANPLKHKEWYANGVCSEKRPPGTPARTARRKFYITTPRLMNWVCVRMRQSGVVVYLRRLDRPMVSISNFGLSATAALTVTLMAKSPFF